MKIKYSRDVDILTLELDEKAPIIDAVYIGQTIVHFSPAREPVLIEILQAREFASALVESVMQPDPIISNT